MTGDCHVRICEGRGVRLPPATRPSNANSRVGGVVRARRLPQAPPARTISLAGVGKTAASVSAPLIRVGVDLTVQGGHGSRMVGTSM